MLYAKSCSQTLLSNSYSRNVYLRSSQIEAQNNGVLYTDSALLTTPAFRGLAVDYNQDPLNGWGSFTVNTTNGFEYTGEQADFYAAINIYYYFQEQVANGSLSENALKVALAQNNVLNQPCGCAVQRSEERRLGKECRSRWTP